MHQHSLLLPHQLARLPLAAAAGLHSSWISASFLHVYETRGQPQSRDPGEQLCLNKVSFGGSDGSAKSGEISLFSRQILVQTHLF